MAPLVGGQRLLLKSVQEIPKDFAGYVLDAEIATKTNLELVDVHNWIETLVRNGYLEVAKTNLGLKVLLTPAALLELSRHFDEPPTASDLNHNQFEESIEFTTQQTSVESSVSDTPIGTETIGVRAFSTPLQEPVTPSARSYGEAPTVSETPVSSLTQSDQDPRGHFKTQNCNKYYGRQFAFQ